MNIDRIAHDFSYHAPTAESVRNMQAIRDRAKDLAHVIDNLAPDCREKSLAITKLEEVVMWANAGIARNQPIEVPGVTEIKVTQDKDGAIPPVAEKLIEAVLDYKQRQARGGVVTNGCGGNCRCKG